MTERVRVIFACEGISGLAPVLPFYYPDFQAYSVRGTRRPNYSGSKLTNMKEIVETYRRRHSKMSALIIDSVFYKK